MPPSRRVGSILWRITLAVLPLGAGLTAVGLLLPTRSDPSDPAVLAMRIAAGAAISVVTLGLTTLLLRTADRRAGVDAGLTHPGAGWRLAGWGALLWFVPAAAAFAVLALRGAPLTVTVPTAELARTVLLLFLAVLLAEAIPEEVVFRGYVTTVLSTRWRGWWVIAVQTFLFTLCAGLLRQDWNPGDLSLFVAMGVVFGYLRLVTGTVWVSIGFHAAFQTGAQLVLTHDGLVFTGGTGAALLALGSIPFVVAAVLVAFTGPARGRPGHRVAG